MNDPKAAWNEMLSVKNFGPGNSKANSLYWVASRPPSHQLNKTSEIKSTRKSCPQNSACDAAGMLGDCCPTPDGVFLGCCPVDVPS